MARIGLMIVISAMNGLSVAGMAIGATIALPEMLRRNYQYYDYRGCYGLVPVILPWDDIEVALQTGELDGVAWCGFTEAYEVGWADVCNYALVNNVTGAWCGSYFANSKSWAKVPPYLQELFKLSMDSSHYFLSCLSHKVKRFLSTVDESLTTTSSIFLKRISILFPPLWQECIKKSQNHVPC